MTKLMIMDLPFSCPKSQVEWFLWINLPQWIWTRLGADCTIKRTGDAKFVVTVSGKSALSSRSEVGILDDKVSLVIHTNSPVSEDLVRKILQEEAESLLNPGAKAVA